MRAAAGPERRSLLSKREKLFSLSAELWVRRKVCAESAHLGRFFFCSVELYNKAIALLKGLKLTFIDYLIGKLNPCVAMLRHLAVFYEQSDERETRFGKALTKSLSIDREELLYNKG